MKRTAMRSAQLGLLILTLFDAQTSAAFTGVLAPIYRMCEEICAWTVVPLDCPAEGPGTDWQATYELPPAGQARTTQVQITRPLL